MGLIYFRYGCGDGFSYFNLKITKLNRGFLVQLSWERGKNLLAIQETGFNSGLGRSWRRIFYPLSIIGFLWWFRW